MFIYYFITEKNLKWGFERFLNSKYIVYIQYIIYYVYIIYISININYIYYIIYISIDVNIKIIYTYENNLYNINK